MLSSVIHQKGVVAFPAFAAERHYMVPFHKNEGLPPALKHWQPTVDAMLENVITDDVIYFMADQSRVLPGHSHRRPGVHVDGYWVPDLKAHGGGGHRGGGGRHRGSGGHMSGSSSWNRSDFSAPEALILASDIQGARAYVGEYENFVGEGGDCSFVPLDNLTPVDLQANTVYVGTVGTLHESLPQQFGTERTIVRLNCPGVSVH